MYSFTGAITSKFEERGQDEAKQDSVVAFEGGRV